MIDPAPCIDCGICEPECPADAIRPDTDPDIDPDPGAQPWLDFNAHWALHWPLIASKRPAPADAADRDGEPGKLERYFTGTAGPGD